MKCPLREPDGSICGGQCMINAHQDASVGVEHLREKCLKCGRSFTTRNFKIPGDHKIPHNNLKPAS